ncbi:MAG: hypothetical protein KAI53_04205, partial [Candidatus Aenigmarchaeota archaeon]|nr:hypothetical protein [Candidatus Aenigmarchaeota archaeon]
KQTEKEALEKLYLKSTEVIDSVTMKNGAILASPPGRRYPYLYPRDCMLILRVLLESGKTKQVKKTLEFVLSLMGETGEWYQRYTKDGKSASYRPPQADCNGLVLFMINQYYKKTKDKTFLENHWNEVYLGARFLEEHYIKEEKLVFSMNSIHEWPPMEAGFEIWANVCAYAGFKAAREIAETLNKKEDQKHWSKIERELGKSIMTQMVKNNHFIKLRNNTNIFDADISEMGAYILGLLPTKDPIIEKTAEFIEKSLYDKNLGGIQRHMEKYGKPGRNNGGYGPYSMYTGWMAQYYLDAGKLKKAKKYIDWFLKYNKNGLIPEHIATKKSFLEWQKEAKDIGRYYKSGRREEAEKVMRTKDFKENNIACWVLPLTWGHAEFMLTYLKLKDLGLV